MGRRNSDNEAEKNLRGLVRALGAKVLYNPVLRVLAVRDEDRNISKLVFESCCDAAGQDKDRLRELNLATRGIRHFSGVRAWYREHILGYRALG